MSKRVKRKKLDISEAELLKPLDITKFGSDDDPCFGKLYNLNTSECKRCGDSEICSIVFSQNQNINRKKIEKNNRFKDIELEHDDIITYIKKLKTKKIKKYKIIKLVKNKYNLTKDEVVKIMKKQ